MDWHISYRSYPRLGADAAGFAVSLMEYLCALTRHAGACRILNSQRYFPFTGRLYAYFSRESERRQAGMTKPEPVQWTYTSSG